MSKKRALRLLLLLGILTLVLTGCGMQPDEQGNLQTPSWLDFIVLPLRLGVTFLNDSVLTPLGIASYGLAIILITIIIRALLYPLTRKQMDSMRKMQEIQPQMKELQEKYGKDREKLAQKQMELYKEAGVNPAGGCLPLLIQMPILFAFYYALIGLGPLLAEPFLWIPDLSFPTYYGGLAWLSPITPQHLLSAEVWPYLVLPIVYVITQFAMQRMSQATSSASQPGSMNQVMMLMPLMFAYITLIVPAGLSLYWITSNVLQIIQQGLTTGWQGLLPKGQEAAAVSGAQPARGKSRSAAGLSDTQVQSQPKPPQVSAGRRRKLRKKKR